MKISNLDCIFHPNSHSLLIDLEKILPEATYDQVMKTASTMTHQQIVEWLQPIVTQYKHMHPPK